LGSSQEGRRVFLIGGSQLRGVFSETLCHTLGALIISWPEEVGGAQRALFASPPGLDELLLQLRQPPEATAKLTMP
jgi:hypothetical protein